MKTYMEQEDTYADGLTGGHGEPLEMGFISKPTSHCQCGLGLNT